MWPPRATAISAPSLWRRPIRKWCTSVTMTVAFTNQPTPSAVHPAPGPTSPARLRVPRTPCRVPLCAFWLTLTTPTSCTLGTVVTAATISGNSTPRAQRCAATSAPRCPQAQCAVSRDTPPTQRGYTPALKWASSRAKISARHGGRPPTARPTFRSRTWCGNRAISSLSRHTGAGSFARPWALHPRARFQ